MGNTHNFINHHDKHIIEYIKRCYISKYLIHVLDENGNVKFQPLYKSCHVQRIPPYLLLSYRNISVVSGRGWPISASIFNWYYFRHPTNTTATTTLQINRHYATLLLLPLQRLLAHLQLSQLLITLLLLPLTIPYLCCFTVQQLSSLLPCLLLVLKP